VIEAYDPRSGGGIPLRIAARPFRLVVLVPVTIEGLGGKAMMEAAVATQVRFWGGSGNLVLPFDAGLLERDLFWAIAERFDPDDFVVYSPTWAEIAEIAPKVEARDRLQLQERMAADGFEAERIEEWLERRRTERPVAASPTPQEMEEIGARLAPFEDPAGGFQFEVIDGVGSASWPFTDVPSFVPTTPGIYAAPQSGPGVGPDRRLLETTVMGRFPAALATELEQRSMDWREMPRPEFLATVLRDGWREDVFRYPWDFSDTGTGTYLRSAGRSRRSVVVVGGEPWDFALFYGLHRMAGRAGSGVFWVSPELEGEQGYLDALARAIRHGRLGRHPALAISASGAASEEVASRLNDLAGSTVVEAGDWRQALPPHPARIYSREDEGHVRRVATSDGAVAEIETPTPSKVTADPANDMRWVSEVSSPVWSVLRNRRSARAALRGLGPESELVRGGREGLAYFSTGGFVPAGSSLKSITVRPELRPVDLLTQIQAVLRHEGIEATPSDKGVFARESARLLGGHTSLVEALRDPGFRAMTDAYLAPAGTEEAAGLFLRSDGRRYLAWRSLEQALGSAAAVDRLSERGVLARGVVFKCANCRSQAFHRIGTVSERFVCGRCETEQAAGRGSWGGSDEPRFSYRLAEVIYELLDKHGELPILAVDDEFGDSDLPLAVAFELEFEPSEGPRELDIVCAVGSDLVIGEATVDGKLTAKRFEFLRRLAPLLNVRRILLATSEEHWSEKTVGLARESFPEAWPELILREGVRTHP
jgi:hypothetical protein